MQQVQQMKSITKKDYNLKIRTYSDKLMAYRVTIHSEYHYIINERYQSEMPQILSFLTALDAKYNDYGVIILQKGYKLFIEPHYMYNYHLGRCTFTHKTDSKVSNLAEYKAAKWLYSKYNTIRNGACHND